MYRKILVPLDGSVLAESVLPHVCTLASDPVTEILLLQIVVEPVYDLLLCGAKLAAATRHVAVGLRESAQCYLDKIAARLRAQGIRVTTQIAEGMVAESILAYGEQAQVDLIVLTTHGLNPIGDWELGKVTYRILHNATVPVLLIRADPYACKHTESWRTAIHVN